MAHASCGFAALQCAPRPAPDRDLRHYCASGWSSAAPTARSDYLRTAEAW